VKKFLKVIQWLYIKFRDTKGSADIYINHSKNVESEAVREKKYKRKDNVLIIKSTFTGTKTKTEIIKEYITQRGKP
jgi:hypothetical protein